MYKYLFFFSSRRRHTRWPRDWSSDVCSSPTGPAPGRWRASPRRGCCGGSTANCPPTRSPTIGSPSASTGSRSWTTTVATSRGCTRTRGTSGASASSPPGAIARPTRLRAPRSPKRAGGSQASSRISPSCAPSFPSASCTKSWWTSGPTTSTSTSGRARTLTGWSIRRPQHGADFEFHDWAHDQGEKQVLGVRFPAGHGMDEGIRLLKLLANHPATLHHVSRQLCQRFVNDEPPDGCVDDAVAAWRRTGGDIREVLRAIFTSPDFWAASNVRAKVKTPLEFVVSAARAVGADPDTTPRLAQVVARLGEPLYLHVAPDGYPEQEAAWVNSGALLDRMNAGVALASGKLPGVTVTLDSLVAATADAGALIAAVDDRMLGGTMSENTKEVIGRQLSDVRDPAQARALAVGLAIGGPEFQRQ